MDVELNCHSRQTETGQVVCEQTDKVTIIFICQMGLVLCFSIPSLNCGFTDAFQWGWFSIWNTTRINFCSVCLNLSFSATFYRSLRSTHGIYRLKSSAKGTSMFHLMRKPHYKTVHSYLLLLLRALKCYRYQKKGKSKCFLPSHIQGRCWQPLQESLVDQRRVEKDWHHSMKLFKGNWRRTACTIVKNHLAKVSVFQLGYYVRCFYSMQWGKLHFQVII